MGHSEGFSSIIVPGAGEANFDALEFSPFETVRQRQKAEIKALLEKLRPRMIGLNSNFVGSLDAGLKNEGMGTMGRLIPLKVSLGNDVG